MDVFKKDHFKFLLVLVFLSGIVGLNGSGQQLTDSKSNYWHDQERVIRYKPDGGAFVITNGTRRFNRALYGTNTAFRVEAGDLPEFALYMPGMGGNLKFGLIGPKGNKWLIKADRITARYRPGSMLYEIEDALLGKGKLFLTVLAMSDAEGVIVRAEFEEVTDNISLVWAFGGASGTKFSRDGDMNVDPESSFYLKPEYCATNSYNIKGNSFSLLYGGSKILTKDERYFADKAVPTADNGKGKRQNLVGAFPPSSTVTIASADQLDSPEKFIESKGTTSPVITGKVQVKSGEQLYFLVKNPETPA